MRLIKKKTELARHYGRGRATIYRWLKEGMPQRADGFFDLDEIDRWLQKRDGIPVAASQDSGNGGGTTSVAGREEGNEGRAHWDAKNKQAQYEERMIKVRQLRGELVKLKDVENYIEVRHRVIKSEILGLQRTLAPELAYCKDVREISEVLQRHFKGLLNRLSQPLPEHLRPEEKA